MEKKTEIIIIRENWVQSIVSDLFTLVMIVSVTGIGVYLNSNAMQWIGFLILLIVAVNRALSRYGDGRMSIEQARRRLDEIERGDG